MKTFRDGKGREIMTNTLEEEAMLLAANIAYYNVIHTIDLYIRGAPPEVTPAMFLMLFYLRLRVSEFMVEDVAEAISDPPAPVAAHPDGLDEFLESLKRSKDPK